jgi:hypothetical protein
MSCPCFDPITASPIPANVQDAYISAGPPEFAAFSRANALAKLIGRRAEARAHFRNGQSRPARGAHGGLMGSLPSPSDAGDAGIDHFLTIDDRVELLIVANIRP